MLADDIQLEGWPPKDAAIARYVKEAPKFVFSPDAVQAARMFTGPELTKSWNALRLPFTRSSWFEFATGDWAFAVNDMSLKRLGYFACQREGGNEIFYRVFMQAYDGRLSVFKHSNKLRIEQDCLEIHCSETEEGFGELLLRLLMVLNVKNLSEVVPSPIINNAARLRRGKRELMDYRICRIPKERRHFFSTSGEGNCDRRYHSVRGHIKTYTDRVVWCPDFMRGNPRKGVVLKDYAV
jgi:hypothetical protein